MRQGLAVLVVALVVMAGCASSPQPAPPKQGSKSAAYMEPVAIAKGPTVGNENAPPAKDETASLSIRGGGDRPAPAPKADSGSAEREARIAALKARANADSKARREEEQRQDGGANETDEMAYLRKYIEGRFLTTVEHNADIGERFSAVVACRLKNNGQRTIKKMTITIYFLGADGKPVHEDSKRLIDTHALGYRFDSTPLRPGYAREFSYVALGAPSDWLMLPHEQRKAVGLVTELVLDDPVPSEAPQPKKANGERSF